MRKVFYSFAVLVVALLFASCSKDKNDHSGVNSVANVEERARSLGFSDSGTYLASVAEQHAAGNHVNCDTQSDGTHGACTYSSHSGTKHDGTDHKGSGHGTHDKNGHSHSNTPTITPPVTPAATASDIENRTKSLGFSDVAAYTANVAAQCAAGDHKNCNVLSNGTHSACADATHLGTKLNGAAHNGTNHQSHDGSGNAAGGSGGTSGDQNHNNGDKNHDNGGSNNSNHNNADKTHNGNKH